MGKTDMTLSIILLVVALSVVACVPPDTIVVDGGSTAAPSTAPAYTEHTFKYTGDFRPHLTGTNVGRIVAAFDGWNSTDPLNRSNISVKVEIVGINASGFVHREIVEVAGMENGTGCSGGAEPDPAYGCANATNQSYTTIIGYRTFSNETSPPGEYDEGTQINIVLKHYTSGNVFATKPIANATFVGDRIFDGSVVNSELFNDTDRYSSGTYTTFNVVDVKSYAIIWKPVCSPITGTNNITFDYEVNSGLGGFRTGHTTNNTGSGAGNYNATVLPDLEPVKLVKITKINTSTIPGNCTLLLGGIGYDK